MPEKSFAELRKEANALIPKALETGRTTLIQTIFVLMAFLMGVYYVAGVVLEVVGNDLLVVMMCACTVVLIWIVGISAVLLHSCGVGILAMLEIQVILDNQP